MFLSVVCFKQQKKTLRRQIIQSKGYRRCKKYFTQARILVKTILKTAQKNSCTRKLFGKNGVGGTKKYFAQAKAFSPNNIVNYTKTFSCANVSVCGVL